MKIATNAPQWKQFAKANGKELSKRLFIEEAAAAGCAGVEISGLDEEFESAAAARDFLERHNIALAAWQANIHYSANPACVDAYEKALRDAAEMGVKTIMTCGGFMSTRRRNTYAFDYDTFAESLGPMVALAADMGLSIAYHPHWRCICETLDETRRIVERVPGLQLCVDTGHLAACGSDPVAFIREMGERIIHTHIKDYSWERDRFAEPGGGDGGGPRTTVDFPACIEALREVGYDGWLCLELDRPWEPGMPKPVEITRQSISYLREHCGV